LYFTSEAQDLSIISDSVFTAKKELDLSEVSKNSVELTLKAREMVDNVMNDEDLKELKDNNQKIIETFNRLLEPESYVKLSTISNRNLKAKLSYWQMNLKTISDQRVNIADAFNKLNNGAIALKKDLDAWKSSENLIKSELLAKTINHRIENTETMIDTTIDVLNTRRTELLILLDDITVLEIEIEELNKRIEKAINLKQKHLLYKDQKALFSLLINKNTNWKIPESLWKYHKNNLEFLSNYMKKNIDRFIFHIALILLLILLFITINKKKVLTTALKKNIYIKRLDIILSKPISAALIIGLFASVLIYPYRPLLFIDLSQFFVVFPIVILLVSISPKIYHKYTYVFATLIVFHIFYLNLPVSHIYSRLIILCISVIELVTFIYFLFELRNSLVFKKNTKKLLQFLFSILLLFSLLSLYGNFVGKVNFSVYFIEVVVGTFLITVLVVFSIVVINGLTVLLIESSKSSRIRYFKKNNLLIQNKLIAFFRFAGILLAIYFILELLHIRQIVIQSVGDFFTKGRSIGSVEFTYGKILIFFIVIWLSVMVGRFISIVLEGDVLNNLKLKKGLPHTIALMVKYTLVSAGIFLAISAAGFPLDSLTVILGAFGVGIGFGLQNIFNNLVSGLILLFERPIQIGDTIEVGTMIGKVNSIGIRSSNIRSLDGAEIIVPNGNLVSNDVINWTLSDDRRRIEVIVGVSYNSDPKKVKEILLKIINEHEDIITDPAPNVFFLNFGESSLDFRMLFWTKEFDQWYRIKSEIMFKIFDELKAAGIEIPFPQRDLHLRSVDEQINLK
jgi:small-conductance mechanosensitive channel